jgi:hypothetical protein
VLSDTETAPPPLQQSAAAAAADVAADAETSADTSGGSEAVVQRPQTVGKEGGGAESEMSDMSTI